ncbi:MAG: YhcH/YjgK/YiaL family protein [Opitutales bacterium]|nr:YhcH/YjgK/YiaL family protein [Opitutales bacterium]
MIVDHIENWKRYSFGSTWELAFSFLEGLTSDSEERRYELDGDDVFAIVMSYPTKRETDADAVLEAHRKYVDIQMALVGSERIACYPVHSLKMKTPYNAERDVEFFTYEKAAKIQLGMFPGTFACLLPQDAHMPQLGTGEERVEVKKVVVKIALDRLEL